jgi:hypothetical protein
MTMARRRNAQPPDPPAPVPPIISRKASIYPPEPLPEDFCQLVARMEMILGTPVWLLIQSGGSYEPFSQLSMEVYKGFQAEMRGRASLPAITLLVESPGGEPDWAFRLARLFQRRTTNFIVAIPQYAKSAATLLALGANKLILGRDAEMGPLDLQVFDDQEERYDSALNAVQSLERLGAYALTAVDQTMQLLLRRMRKRSDVLAPLALNYVAALLKPLLEKVDTVDYARKSRDLKVTEEYAARLMRRAYGLARGRSIARKLVENYPAHGFVIDTEEAFSQDDPNSAEASFGLGLKSVGVAPDLQVVFDEMTPFLDSLTAIGMVQEIV